MSDWCLADKSVLVSIASAPGAAPFPLALSAAIIGLWRDLQWPVVHFLPDYVRARPALASCGLIQPGALLFESDSSSIWSCQRFCEFHKDIGGAPIVIIGGEIDKSVLSVAVGAVDRNVCAFYIPETSGVSFNNIHKSEIKNTILTIMSNLAVKLTVDDLFYSLNRRNNGNYANGDLRL